MPLHSICNTIAGWLAEPEPKNPSWPSETWETFQFVCRVHGVAPLLRQKIGGAAWLAKPTRSWLAEQYAFNSRRIAKMHAELKEILALFGQHNIPLMPLKGSIISVEYYQDPGQRPMADLDLLIRAENFEAGARLLNRLGYERAVTHWKHIEFSRPGNRQVVSTTCEHPDNPRKLELHLRCRETFGGPTLDLTEMMWEHATRGDLLGEQTLLPTIEALWLHGLVHATYHIWQGRGRLIHLIDLARLSPHLANPQRWLAKVDARFTYPALALQQQYLPGSLGDALLANQQQRVSVGFRQWVDTLDLVNTSYLNSKPVGLYVVKAIKFSEGRPAEMLRLLRFALLPGLEEIALDHPRLAQSKAPWLGYFLLPLDWARRVISR